MKCQQANDTQMVFTIKFIFVNATELTNKMYIIFIWKNWCLEINIKVQQWKWMRKLNWFRLKIKMHFVYWQSHLSIQINEIKCGIFNNIFKINLTQVKRLYLLKVMDFFLLVDFDKISCKCANDTCLCVRNREFIVI